MSNQDEQDVFNDNQEKYLKSYFKRLDKTLGVTKDTPEYLSVSFNKKLMRLAYSKKGVNWKSIVTSIVASFSIGMLVTRLALTPTLATRGVHSEQDESQYGGAGVQVISLKVDKPKEYAFKIIDASLDAGVTSETLQSGKKIQLVIKHLKPNAPEQHFVKQLLNLNDEEGGDFTAIISKK